ncbi:hypothetical protein [uncultured Adlercreutzia sp.]|uniref:hypothetical protein n=1 Tax=uncultured Adlercreutzia sp. TaxID=875803 RepID=UPI0025FE8B63|nr:hypothetical protein [uncultured Adlercreutzia sp.]
MRGDAEQRRRLRRAILAVAALVLGAALSGVAQEGARVVERARDPLMEGAQRAADEAPSWFVEEVGLPDGAQELRATDDWTVVGYAEEGAASEASARLVERLEARGWHLLETGASGMATGWKEGGALSWIAFSCTDIGGVSSTVIQVPAGESSA